MLVKLLALTIALVSIEARSIDVDDESVIYLTSNQGKKCNLLTSVRLECGFVKSEQIAPRHDNMTFVLYKDGVEIGKMVDNIYEPMFASSYRLKSMKYKDAGIYWCELKNEMGTTIKKSTPLEMTITGFLDIIGPFSNPPSNSLDSKMQIICDIYSDQPFEVTWEFNRQKIEAQDIDFEQVFEERSLDMPGAPRYIRFVDNIKSYRHILNVQNHQNHIGNYKCSAINKFGDHADHFCYIYEDRNDKLVHSCFNRGGSMFF